jgi:glycine oxidase
LPAPVPVRPVKGQTLRLRVNANLLRQVVRGSVKGNPVYLVPRVNGEMVIGASSEEAGFDLRARAGAVYDLLRDAQTLVPELSEAEFVEVSTSVRPGSADNSPLLGRADVSDLIIATGHFRNGILLAPVTADEIAKLVIDGDASDVIAPFAPSRLSFEARRSNDGTETTADRIRAAQMKAYARGAPGNDSIQEAHA